VVGEFSEFDLLTHGVPSRLVKAGKREVLTAEWMFGFHSSKNRSLFMANVDRAYNHIRNELADVGLLADGAYLDTVELCISHEKSGCGGERGYVFEYVGHYAKRGYRPGVIYLPKDLPHKPYKPGLTLMDTIRHEYAHAWYYIDPGFFRQDWFVRTFGATYCNESPLPYQTWRKELKRNEEYLKGKARRKTDGARLKYFYSQLLQSFITDYATTNACEDFAETFMFYLKYRRSLERFASRPVVFQKLKMVERAVAMASRRTRQFGEKTFRRRTA
jgi:hypothetical protein